MQYVQYTVTLTYDLHDAPDAAVRHRLESMMAEWGLSRTLFSAEGDVIEAPSTTLIGRLDGPSREELSQAVADDFEISMSALGLTGRYLVVASSDGKWVFANTATERPDWNSKPTRFNHPSRAVSP